MQVREVMTRGVECARPDDSITVAAERMWELNVGSLPVCGDGDRLVGVLTDRDITVRATAAGSDPASTYVGDVMTPQVVYCYEDQDVSEAAELMKQKQVRRLVVLDRDKRLVGIVSLGDLAVDAGDEQMAGSALEAISEPAHPSR
jgi:CBS domain-containing protein